MYKASWPRNYVRLQVESGTGVGFHPLHLYIDYLSYLYRKTPELSESEQLEANYRDILQSPLQPLMDNLESQTYEIFEKDTMKYQLYEDAIFQCLCDRNADKEKETSKSPQVVVVVGAGTLVIPSRQFVYIYIFFWNVYIYIEWGEHTTLFSRIVSP